MLGCTADVRAQGCRGRGQNGFQASKPLRPRIGWAARAAGLGTSDHVADAPRGPAVTQGG
jgi:hypothetical protein